MSRMRTVTAEFNDWPAMREAAEELRELFTAREVDSYFYKDGSGDMTLVSEREWTRYYLILHTQQNRSTA